MTNAMHRDRKFSVYFVDLDIFLLALRGTKGANIGPVDFYHGFIHGKV